jgi:hypothetical protein
MGYVARTSHLSDVKYVIPWQFPFAHGTDHDVTERGRMLLAYCHIGVRRLQIHVHLKDLRDGATHLDEPLFTDTVNGGLRAVDDAARAQSTINCVIVMRWTVIMRWRRHSLL